jgi:hypothetical protein
MRAANPLNFKSGSPSWKTPGQRPDLNKCTLQATSIPSCTPTSSITTVIDPIADSTWNLQLRAILRCRLMTAPGECLGATFSVD